MLEVVGAAVAGGFGPVLRGWDIECFLRPDAGWERDAGDGEADHLTLTAAEAANGIAHEEEIGKVVSAQGGTAEALGGAELALDRHTVERVYTEVRGTVARRVSVL